MLTEADPTASSTASPDLYARRGVSSGKEDVHRAIRNLDKGLFPQAFCKVLPDTLTGSPEHCLIMHADTAGTKTSLAYLYWRETGDLTIWAGIVQDAIVMTLEEMLGAGAQGPILLNSVIARNKRLIPAEVLEALIQGTVAFQQEMAKHGVDLQLTGGETADVGDIVRTVDVGFTAFARMARNEVIRNEVRPGLKIVGLASYGQATYETQWNSGIGCNGLTSARHDLFGKWYAEQYPETIDTGLDPAVVYTGKFRVQDASPVAGLNMGQLALSPTRTYAPLLIRLLKEYRQQVHGLIHNTGGGLTKGMKYLGNHRVVKRNLPEAPAIFRLIRQQSGISQQEAYRTFNMGVRLELYVEPEVLPHLTALAASFGIEAWEIGEVQGASARPELVIESSEGSLEYAL
jgi:phosphoribosylformylglycinamidine cyclo-ligase